MAPTAPIRVLLVDDHQLFSDGLRAMLSGFPQIEVVEQVYHSPNVFARVDALRPDVILLDFNMPQLNGVEAAEKLMIQNPSLRIIIISMYREARYIEQCKKMGVKGYLLKTANVSEVVEAIECVSQGGNWYKPALTKANGNNHSEDYFLKTFSLTNREMAVLRLIREGCTSQEISEKLSISLMTVETHRKNMCTKLNLKGKNELLRFALEHDL
jgi:DNA-binding NarL/FixJ family response regulator